MPDDTTLRASIELVGEQQYRAAMAEINRQLRETKSALSAAAAEFASADAATRTSAAQADALTQSLEQQRERMALMQAQLEKVEEKYGKNSKAAVELRTRINNARAEMAKTEGQLRALSDGLDASADAAQSAGEDMGGAAKGFEDLGDSAQRAQDDVRSLAGEIGSVVGQKLIEFEVGKKALEQLAAGFKWALGEAIDGQKEYGLFLSGAGDPVLADARAAIQSEIDKMWAGRLDGTQTQSAIETVDTAMDNASLISPDYVEQITNMVITLQERWGVAVSELMEGADSMRKTFGMAWEESFDLMTLGFQNAHDGGAQMLKVMEENAQMFKAMGYDADDMFSVIIAACNDENLGKDSNLNKGMTQLFNTVTSGSKESVEAMKALGLEATDWPAKLQEGGDAAALAMQELLGALLSIEDTALRNDLGKTLFGDTVWTQTGGDIARALLAGYGQTIEAEGANAFVQDALLDNLGDAWAQASERINQEAEKAAEPFINAATEALKQFSASFDEGDGFFGSLADALGTGVQVLTEPVFAAFESIRDEAGRQGTLAGEAWGENYAQSVNDALSGGAEVTVEPPSIDDLLEQRSNAAGEGNEALVAELDAQIEDAASQAVENAKGGATLTVDDLFAARAQAAGEGNDALVAELDAQIEAACAKTSPTATAAGETLGEEFTTGIENKQGEAYDAGEQLGDEGVLGTQSGLAGMYDAGMNGAAGAVSGLETGIDDAYSAGYRTGKAYERGFKAAQKIESPSKIMQLAAQYSVEGLLTGYDEGEIEVRARGAALAEAFEDGYSARGTFTSPDTEALNTQAGISSTELAEALREALSGLGLYFDGQRTGEVIAPGVSGSIARRSAATVRGRSARIKGW